jgi:hypothetical protein
MLPDVALDRGGRAHIVYTHDPEPGQETAEEGDIRYVTSEGPPYSRWSPPTTINDDGYGRAQGMASIAIRHRGQASIIDVIWEDTRLAPHVPDPSDPDGNLFYDIFHSRKVPGLGAPWSPNTRVSDESSRQDALNSGERTALVASDTLIFAVWTDRREATSPFQALGDILGSRILPGRGGRN